MFKKILVPVDVDYPKTAAAVYQEAAAIARMSGGEVKLVSVMPGFGMPLVASYIPGDVKKEMERKFREAVEVFIREHCDPSVTYKIATGKSWEETIRVAENWGADLIVVYYNRHREVNEMFSSTCSKRVSELAACSVLRLRNLKF